jgi:hypothetical protein
MIRKYKLPFVCNALTKKDTFRSLRDLLFGRKNKRFSQFQDQWSSFLKVPKEQLFFFGSGRMGVYTFLGVVYFEQPFNDSSISAKAANIQFFIEFFICS